MRICFNERLSNHKFDSLTSLVQINLSEELLSTCEDNIDVVVDLFVVSNLVVYDTGIGNDALVGDLRSVYFGMH